MLQYSLLQTVIPTSIKIQTSIIHHLWKKVHKYDEFNVAELGLSMFREVA